MQHRATLLSFALATAFLLELSACSSLPNMPKFPSFSKKKNDGLSQVDDLLSHVEGLQVEATLSKEKANGALDLLHEIVAPRFDGDPVAAFADLGQAIEASRAQAETLGASIPPMKKVAESVFEQWTASLESIGNTQMRQRSQARLEATRMRYEAIVSSAVSAQLAFDAFNADMHDHALYLEHDFNAAAVSTIADDVESLGERGDELDGRFDKCAAACKSYVESSALRGQLAVSGSNVQSQKAAGDGAVRPAARRRRTKPVEPPVEEASEEADATEGAP